jgi:hypothetical protein
MSVSDFEHQGALNVQNYCQGKRCARESRTICICAIYLRHSSEGCGYEATSSGDLPTCVGRRDHIVFFLSPHEMALE